MGLFNAHAVAQQRADRIATLLQSCAGAPRATPRGGGPAPAGPAGRYLPTPGPARPQ
ncbi:hypothetical protein, partial [Pseudomonas aeruginosa]|uniref:hypothetical protein n=1 Tax=Pseudomonas aeruginosa TaxID=287 RepID=UPI003F4B21F8